MKYTIKALLKLSVVKCDLKCVLKLSLYIKNCSALG